MTWGARSFLAAVGAIAFATLAEAQAPELGSITFPTSGSKEAQVHFLQGTKYLHSFEFDEAGEAFREAQKLDPTFAMAYWGEAMSYNHPLWAEQDMAAARKVLARLGETRTARAAKAPTAREKGYLEAIEILYGEGDKLGRDIAYSEAMERLAGRLPDDKEAAAFYALSLLGTVRPGDQGFRRQIKAAAIVQQIFQENPNHPGAAHYLIHSFDDPTHAILGLASAERYAKIAPAAPHALHMPSHIFVQLGMWDRVAASNKAAYAASEAWAERRGMSRTRRDFHSLSWLQYSYLQLGRHAEAKATLDLVRPVAEQSDAPRVKGALASMTARYIIETGQWQRIPVAAQAGGDRYAGDASTLLAAGMSAAKLGDLATAEQAEARLAARVAEQRAAGRAYSAKPLEIMQKELTALIRLAKGQNDEAVAAMKEATAIEEAMDPPSGPPEPLKPSHELFGEILLQLEQPKEAAAQFQQALLRMPNRTQSLLGSARAAAKSGDKTTARRHYNQLMKIWGDDSRLAAVEEVKRFLSEGDQP